MRRVLGLPALALALVLVAAACGGGGGPKPLTKAEYVKQMQKIGRSLSNSLNSLGTATASTKTAAAALVKVQEDLRNAADQLDKIKPPDDIKDEHARLATGVRDFADEMDPLVKKLQGGNIAALSSLTTLKGVSEIQAASTAITKKGYKIGA
jgi:hypothetical protein